VHIGRGLINGGPASLFMAFTICAWPKWSHTYQSHLRYIRFAGRYVDEAFGIAAGWNFLIFEAALVPFEVVACNVVINFWSDVVPAGGIIAIVLVLYLLINILAVKWWRTRILGCAWKSAAYHWSDYLHIHFDVGWESKRRSLWLQILEESRRFYRVIPNW
jgi:hypothetical protein